MANRFSQIYLHIVFAPKYRLGLLNPEWYDQLYAILGSIASRNGHRLICRGAMPDHIHQLYSIGVGQSISDLIRDLKTNTSKWINDNRLTVGRFEWQKGYGVFSVSPTHLEMITNYINNQEEHHQKNLFIDEFRNLLRRNNLADTSPYQFDLPV